MDLGPTHRSEPICQVEASGLVEWCHARSAAAGWIVQPFSHRNPQRLFRWPGYLVLPIVAAVLARLGDGCEAEEVVLSRTQPGQYHGLHTDRQGHRWLTRVHVPLVTSPDSWHRFEDGERFHMPVGWAYSFNTEVRHEFGNGGPEPRIHLHFDVRSRAMARICGIDKRAVREDDPMTVIRLAPEDIHEDDKVQGKQVTPGLYHVGEDAYQRFAPRVIARLKKTPAIGDDGKPVVDADGKPVMTLPESATIDNVGPHHLI